MILLLLLITFDQPSSWHRYETPDKKLTLAFPRKPIELSESKKMTQGEVTVVTVTVSRTRFEEAGYVLTWYDLKEPKTNEAEIRLYLQSIEHGSIKAKQGKRIHTKSVTLGKHPGREFTWSIETGFIRTQIYLVNKRFVTVMYMSGTEQELTSLDAKNFFESLKVSE
jgi:hypothetical protein